MEPVTDPICFITLFQTLEHNVHLILMKNSFVTKKLSLLPHFFQNLRLQMFHGYLHEVFHISRINTAFLFNLENIIF